MVEGGDQNIRFSHSIIKQMRIRNSIVSIKTPEGGIIEEVEGVKEEVAKVFFIIDLRN